LLTGNTIKTFKKGNYGVLANLGYDIHSKNIWKLSLHYGNSLKIGVALKSIDLSSNVENNGAVFKLFDNIKEDTFMILFIYNKTLRIDYLGESYKLDLSSLDGNIVYPWISSTENTIHMSVTISKVEDASFYINNKQLILDLTNEAGETLEFLIKSQTFNISSINGLTPVGGLYSGLSDSQEIKNTTDELSLLPLTGVGSLSVPANGFSTGDSFHLLMTGKLNSHNGGQLTIKVKSQDSLFASIVSDLNNVVDNWFKLDAYFTIRELGEANMAKIVSTVEFTYSDNNPSSLEGSKVVRVEENTFDTTIDNTLQITAQFSQQDTHNSIIAKQVVLRKIY
jgi:hypothetical protein